MASIKELQESIKSILVNIQSNQSNLKSQLDVLVNQLHTPEVLRIITNKELLETIEFVKNSSAGAGIGVEYNLALVPFPKPLEFKHSLTVKNTAINEVYRKILKASNADLQIFSALYMLNESLWVDHWEPEDSIESLSTLISLINLTPKELQILQHCLDEHNLDISIIGDNKISEAA